MSILLKTTLLCMLMILHATSSLPLPNLRPVDKPITRPTIKKPSKKPTSKPLTKKPTTKPSTSKPVTKEPTLFMPIVFTTPTKKPATPEPTLFMPNVFNPPTKNPVPTPPGVVPTLEPIPIPKRD